MLNGYMHCITPNQVRPVRWLLECKGKVKLPFSCNLPPKREHALAGPFPHTVFTEPMMLRFAPAVQAECDTPPGLVLCCV